MIKIVIGDKVFTTEDFRIIHTNDGYVDNWVEFNWELPSSITWDEKDELFEMSNALTKLNEKGFCIKVEYVDGTWDVDILNATPQEAIKDPSKKNIGRIDRILGVMAKLP